MNVPLYIAVMAILVLMSAYFSATETAFSSLSKTRLKLLSEENKRAALALRLSEDYDKLISTILIGNNIVNIALATLGTLFFVEVPVMPSSAYTLYSSQSGCRAMYSLKYRLCASKEFDWSSLSVETRQ